MSDGLLSTAIHEVAHAMAYLAHGHGGLISELYATETHGHCRTSDRGPAHVVIISAHAFVAAQRLGFKDGSAEPSAEDADLGRAGFRAAGTIEDRPGCRHWRWVSEQFYATHLEAIEWWARHLCECGRMDNAAIGRLCHSPVSPLYPYRGQFKHQLSQKVSHERPLPGNPSVPLVSGREREGDIVRLANGTIARCYKPANGSESAVYVAA